MSFSTWFRQLFASPKVGATEGVAATAPDEIIGAPGVSGFAAIESAEAADAVVEETDPQPDPPA